MLRHVIRLILKISLLAALLASLTGCWSKQELNDRTFVSAMLVDLNENGQTEVSTLFMLPNRISTGLNSNVPNTKPFVLITGSGADVAEALQHIQQDLPRTVTWGQIQVVIIGDRFARKGLKPLFDHLIRATDFRLPIYVFYFNGMAKNLAKLETIFERFPTEVWREAAHMKQVPPIRIRELLYSVWNNFGDSYIPELSMRDMKLLSEGKTVKWSGVGGAAIMKDSKVIDRFTNEEMPGLLLLKNRVPEMLITGQLPGNDGVYSARLEDTRPNVYAIREGSNVKLHVTIEGSADLVAIESNMNLTTSANIKKLEAVINRRIEQLVRGAADKAKSEQVDTFQWSEKIKYKYPQLWQEWSDNPREQMFAHMKLEFDIKVTLRGTGVSRTATM
ncbi:Ger(x)C family spore germination protein [Paenibacillus whitsoniae]|uniref:Ger(X)C family spore germination protein n=1 Tax=Paenibacillus whitsoniae TaxID=2496558 RepID=A0A430J6C2_9BACL|nr:Ger(x)C family spore germination protein [Paenibacillus whitsoniae]RTE04272.1 Ger(x)C family spore germination protein [Paenibacillus whitsoniae]